MDPNLRLTVAFLAVLVLETVVGILDNIFIIFVICFHNGKRQEAKAGDAILVALGITSVCQGSALAFNILSNYIGPKIYKEMYVSYIVFFLTAYVIMSCAWLTASLFFFYFSKITTSSWRPLQWVKLKINTVVNWLVLASEIASVFSCFPIFISLIKPKSIIGGNIFTNVSSDTYDIAPKNIYLICTCAPLFIIIITTACSAASLNLHAKKMEKNAATSTNGNIKMYQNIVRKMFYLLLFYVMFYVSFFLFLFDVFTTLSIGYWIQLLVMFSLTPVQSVFLIVVTPKLKEAWIHVFSLIKEKITVCLNVGL
ncbi:taste receptor type 2 member 8-like [Rana temporaria]|uniref:taste receptor type 2 member 8-like n=1 Tax=Rana temporaria TaxID=8407 RepID=UPI001AAD6AF0|nr:taste receptor type 2 member 8-like [Rana temporaria]